MTENPLPKWQGKFGDAYVKRNKEPRLERTRDLEAIMDKARGAQYMLEVGCNVGNNIRMLTEGLGYDVVGIEPNATAVKQGVKSGLQIIQGDGLDLPFADRSFDLVYSCGVLMHIPLSDARKVIEEMIRVSKRYVLTIELENMKDEEEQVVYRGNVDMLWKRNYDPILRAAKLFEVSHGKTQFYEGDTWRLFRK